MGKGREGRGEEWERKRGMGGKEKERGSGVKPRKTDENHDLYQIWEAPVPTSIFDLGHIWHVTAGPRYTLPCQISSWLAYTTIYNHAKMTNVGNFWGPYPHLSTHLRQIWLAWVHPRCARIRQISSDSVFFVAPEKRKPPILQFFNFVIPWWLRPALQRQSWTWVHIYKHIQRYQGRFRIPKRSWQSGVHELFKSVMYKKSNKKHRTFSFPGGAIYPSPTKPGIVIVEFCTLLAPQNTFASNA